MPQRLASRQRGPQCLQCHGLQELRLLADQNHATGRIGKGRDSAPISSMSSIIPTSATHCCQTLAWMLSVTATAKSIRQTVAWSPAHRASLSPRRQPPMWAAVIPTWAAEARAVRSWRCISPSSSEPALAGALLETGAPASRSAGAWISPPRLFHCCSRWTAFRILDFYPMLLPKNPPKVYGFIISK